MLVEDFCRHISRILSHLDGPLRLEMAAREVAAYFDVDPHEVGFFQVDSAGRTATFVWPPHGGSAIHIPLKTSVSSLVATTAREMRGVVDNQFAATPHLHMFEHGLSDREQRVPVQRIMSAPVVAQENALRWIVQVSRKGRSVEEAGPAFTESNLRELERVAQEFARIGL